MSRDGVHKAAIVAAGARLASGVVVGAYAIIEDEVEIGEGTRVEAHAVIKGPTKIGARNVVSSFAALGGDPQDRRWSGERTRLEIGDDNVFREHVTVHRGTAQGGAITRIGAGGLFMCGAHVAHDCTIGDGVTLANDTLLGGHVTVGDHAVTGGGVAIAPFVRVGARAFLAGGAMVERDVPPFVIAAGDRARVRALNVVGLDRTGVPETSNKALKRAFFEIFRNKSSRAGAAAALVDSPDPFVRELARFVTSTRSA